MSFLSNFFKSPKPLLNEKDQEELMQIKKEAYMKTARLMMEQKGEQQAKKDLGIKPSKEQF